MRDAWLSIRGLYDFDKTIFELLELPNGIDKNTLIQSICAECAELELLYPNPAVMKGLIGVWSKGSQHEWANLVRSMGFDYNPIDNYDRTETRTLNSQDGGRDVSENSKTRELENSDSETVESEGAGTGRDGGTDQFSNTKTHSATNSNSATKSGTTSSLEKTAAFNSAALIDKSSMDGTNSDTASGTDTEQGTDTESASTTYGKTKNETFTKNDSRSRSGSESETGSETETTNYGKTRQDIETIHAHGNIGVTTVMAMIKEFREISNFNIYDILTEEFKFRFCLGVY